LTEILKKHLNISPKKNFRGFTCVNNVTDGVKVAIPLLSPEINIITQGNEKGEQNAR